MYFKFFFLFSEILRGPEGGPEGVQKRVQKGVPLGGVQVLSTPDMVDVTFRPTRSTSK